MIVPVYPVGAPVIANPMVSGLDSLERELDR
jgi:hypothetical protein